VEETELSITAFRPRSLGSGLAGLIGLLCAACASTPPSICDLAGVRGQMLRIQDSVNATCLQSAREKHAALASWIDREGTPDYMKVDSARVLRIFYIERDETVTFKEPLLIGSTQATPRNPIRSDYYVDFANVDRERLGRVRLGTGTRPAVKPRAASSGVTRKRVGGDEEDDPRQAQPR
jgi:hypothetical protein